MVGGVEEARDQIQMGLQAVVLAFDRVVIGPEIQKPPASRIEYVSVLA
jgi:hypothetical protein